MLWIIGFLIILVALLIPILAIVLDSPFVQKLAESRRGAALGTGEAEQLRKRVRILEGEVDDLGRAMMQLREETQFLQRLLEGNPPPKLPPSS